MSIVHSGHDPVIEVYEVPREEAERTAVLCIRIGVTSFSAVKSLEGKGYEFILEASDLIRLIAAGAGPRAAIIFNA